MKTWQKIALVTLGVVLIVAARFYFLWKERQDPGIVARQQASDARTVDKDTQVEMRQFYFNTFDSAKQLEGTKVWIKAGYSLPYYPFVDGKVVFAKRVGVLPAAERLDIAKIQKATTPAKEENRIDHGSKQYFIVFALPSQPDSNGAMYAAPIGFVKGDNETFYSDQLFYYDDPKTIYDHWPKPVWDAVAAHEPRVGMTENQTQMALGIMLQSDSQSVGNRTVTYDAGGKSWTVTFANGVATAVKAG